MPHTFLKLNERFHSCVNLSLTSQVSKELGVPSVNPILFLVAPRPACFSRSDADELHASWPPRTGPGKLSQTSWDTDTQRPKSAGPLAPFVYLFQHENTQREARGRELEHMNTVRWGHESGTRSALAEACACSLHLPVSLRRLLCGTRARSQRPELRRDGGLSRQKVSEANSCLLCRRNAGQERLADSSPAVCVLSVFQHRGYSGLALDVLGVTSG